MEKPKKKKKKLSLLEELVDKQLRERRSEKPPRCIFWPKYPFNDPFVEACVNYLPEHPTVVLTEAKLSVSGPLHVAGDAVGGAPQVLHRLVTRVRAPRRAAQTRRVILPPAPPIVKQNCNDQQRAVLPVKPHASTSAKKIRPCYNRFVRAWIAYVKIFAAK